MLYKFCVKVSLNLRHVEVPLLLPSLSDQIHLKSMDDFNNCMDYFEEQLLWSQIVFDFDVLRAGSMENYGI